MNSLKLLDIDGSLSTWDTFRKVVLHSSHDFYFRSFTEI